MSAVRTFRRNVRALACSRAAGVFTATSAFAGATINGTVTYDGKVPNLKPLAMDADPACASKHTTRSPNEMLVLGSGNTMGNIIVSVKSGLPAGKTYPAPKDPVVMDQNGCQYKPHVFALQVGQELQGAELRRRAPQRARAPQGQRPVQHGDARDPQGRRAHLRQGRGHPFHDQVRRPPVDDRARRRSSITPTSASPRTTASSRSPTSLPAPTRSRPGTRSSGPEDREGHRRRGREQDGRLQVHRPWELRVARVDRGFPRRATSISRAMRREGTGPNELPEPHGKGVPAARDHGSRARASRGARVSRRSTSSRPITRRSGSSTPSRRSSS